MKYYQTSEIQKYLYDKNTVIIDARPVDAYNGWKCKGEKRGGHIKGAKSLPAKWTKYMDWIEIVRYKKISYQNNIIVYGYTNEEIKKVVNKFLNHGYKKIGIYDKFLTEWVNNRDLPMDKLPKYKHLVSAKWVKKLLSGEIPPEFNNNNFVICHTHYRNREAYLSGHIPRAIDMDTLAIEAPETWNRRSPEELKKAFEQHGITTKTTVIVYGKYMSPRNEDDFPGSAAGQLAAFRTAMIMLYAGVEDVRILNGGFQAWIDEGYEISTEDVPKHPVKDFGGKIPAKPEIIVDIEKAKQMLKAKNAELVCVRSWSEYIGQVSGYNYIEKTGRIPGAIFGNCGSDAYHMENYRNLDHTVREAQEIEEMWRQAGITPDKHLAFYCGTGWRGSEAFINAWLMGWKQVSVFDGGWFEWSKDPNNPIESGIPK